ncbi:hypothetical protein [Halocalculus aciditolerans]|uniref:Uncharacterized protein n=1 Tax=Halocalculus aciditolerans TaxID=1383812 RepID=A0A830FCQ1_9EURY|nr:hypothetical protein [Halocalculus aciditolerans]GGL61725.1 hypothetical protein GCM10009039_19900 [Halocalculus aciditolerans]
MGLLDKLKSSHVLSAALTILLGWVHVAARLGLVAIRVLARLTGVGVIAGGALLTNEERRRDAHHWLLLAGNRWHIVGAMVGALVLFTFAAGLLGIIGVRESGFVTNMFSTINAGLFSFVPIVIAINSLTISRLFGTPEGLRDRIADVEEFRENVETLSRVTVSPTDPAGFLALIVDTVQDRGHRLVEQVEDAPDDTRDDVADYVGRILEDMDHIETELAQGDASIFSVLLPMVNDEYSRDINRARELSFEHADDLSEDAEETLSDLQDLLVSADVARQYFKIVYLQQELSALSRYLAYSGISAFVMSIFIIMIYASGYPPIVDATPLLFLVSFSLGLAFLPFSILFAHTIRVATIVKRTSAPGAFTPQGERPGHLR